QMCDERSSGTTAYHQCTECKRFICPTCTSLLPANMKKCPNCAGPLILMPRTCNVCNVTYNDLQLMQGKTHTCPSCNNPLSFSEHLINAPS
ncbi:MAG: hypothetical protein ACXACA_04235, partial [Candidatus Ranarchaeia archaeon]